MKGYELRLWRKGFCWDQERAAEEVGMCLRTYKTYEKKTTNISKTVELATKALSLKHLYPNLKDRSTDEILKLVKTVVPD